MKEAQALLVIAYVILLGFLSVSLHPKRRISPPKTLTCPRPMLIASCPRPCEQPSCLEASLCGPSFPNLSPYPCSSAKWACTRLPVCSKPLSPAEMRQMNVEGKQDFKLRAQTLKDPRGGENVVRKSPLPPRYTATSDNARARELPIDPVRLSGCERRPQEARKVPPPFA